MSFRSSFESRLSRFIGDPIGAERDVYRVQQSNEPMNS